MHWTQQTLAAPTRRGGEAKVGSLKYAAMKIGCSLPTLYDLIQGGKLRSYHIGRLSTGLERPLCGCAVERRRFPVGESPTRRDAPAGSNYDHPEVVDADLADYFGSIPHAELMRSLARRIVDARVLHLIKMWLECAVEDPDDKGRKRRTTEAKDSGRGIPQGSPISPLLANLYMRRFVLGWKKLGLEESLGSRIVT